ncbi:MAG: nucleoside triphosphate pyrophosphohydrolase [Myxococcales bacterium]|nr:nucleoside triphosphate pyrophosphohydrolase [Myxococcales bacterium]
MRRLLAPDGCPWDREQTLETLKGYLLEECYEVIDAIDAGDKHEHEEELGDLLFQIVFQSALADIEMAGVITAIGDKLIRRHPHVFGELEVEDSDEVLQNWERIKATERGGSARSALAGVPRAMPPLARANQLLVRAERVGFRWPDDEMAREKVDEELRELDEARGRGDVAHAEAELGDALFALVSFGRRAGLDPERALASSAARFQRRFTAVEREIVVEGGGSIAEASDDALFSAWERAKARE